jgi:hypothetical protein
MRPFNQNEAGYTATATNVTFAGATDYNPAILDNPVREKVSFAVVQANIRGWKRYATL